MLTHEGSVRDFISKYEQEAFALSLSLLGGSKDAAYDLTVASFVKAFVGFSPTEKEERRVCRLISAIVAGGEEIKVIPSRGETEFLDLPPPKRQSLLFIRQALQKLPWPTRARLLLRDQMHLPYKTIAMIERTSPRRVKIQVTQARGELRDRLEDILRIQSV